MSKIVIVNVSRVLGRAARGLAMVGVSLVPAPASDALADQPAQVMAVAQKLNSNLASAEARLVDATEELFLAVEQAIGEISTDGQSLDPALRTITGLRALLKELRTNGAVIVNAHVVFIAAAKGYQNELAHAPGVLDSLASRYRQFAAEETYQDLRDRYAQDAETVLAVKALLVARRAELDPQVKLVEDNRRYVERTVVYLGRLEELLNSFPDLVDGAKTEAFLVMLKRYVDHFGRLKNLLEGFHSKVTTGKGSYTHQPRSLKALAAKGPTKPPVQTANQSAK